jgi:hypothetical protein
LGAEPETEAKAEWGNNDPEKAAPAPKANCLMVSLRLSFICTDNISLIGNITPFIPFFSYF